MGNQKRGRTRRRLLRSLPPVAFRARLLGPIAYLCPHCANPIRLRSMRHRHRYRCRRCRRITAFGLYGHLGGPSAQPVHLRTLFGDQRHLYHVNRLTLQPTDVTVPAIGRIIGTLEWHCLYCARWVSGQPDWTTGLLQCPTATCPPFWVSLLLWSIRLGTHRLIPHDWIPPLPAESLPAPGPESQPRPDRHGTGDPCQGTLWS